MSHKEILDKLRRDLAECLEPLPFSAEAELHPRAKESKLARLMDVVTPYIDSHAQTISIVADALHERDEAIRKIERLATPRADEACRIAGSDSVIGDRHAYWQLCRNLERELNDIKNKYPGNHIPQINAKHPKAHEACDTFWAYWKANGITHVHGYYESTWGAINAALVIAGVVSVPVKEASVEQ